MFFNNLLTGLAKYVTDSVFACCPFLNFMDTVL